VGGGNTKSMLAVWREWKLDKLLMKAYNRGAILCALVLVPFVGLRKGLRTPGQVT